MGRNPKDKYIITLYGLETVVNGEQLDDIENVCGMRFDAVKLPSIIVEADKTINKPGGTQNGSSN